jgi:DNA primase
MQLKIEGRKNVQNRIHVELIPEEIIEEVRLRADVVEVISEYVSLQRKGKNYWGLCPFHSEKSSSFTVNPEKQMFYCFGCNTGGNIFTFMMKKENWSFVECVQNLANRYGVSLPEREQSPREREENRLRRRLKEINEWAASYYHDILLRLPEGEPGRVYFAKRGIDIDTMKNFRLGYAPARWDGLLVYMQERGVQAHELAEAGLAVEKEILNKGRRQYYDRFRNRVLFSILDQRKQPIAFGGRVLDDSMPKYLNSPDSALFNKGYHLYGIHRAHQGIRDEGFALLVEGYMDVIALQNAGFANTVASLGTALTKEQAKLLKRYTKRVVLLYDSDEAGIQASFRGGDILRDFGIRVDVLILPGAKDPDDFLKEYGAVKFKEALSEVVTFVEFKYRTFVREKPPQGIPEKAELVHKLASDILKVTSPVEREGYERFLSSELGLTLEAVQREIASSEATKPKKERKKEFFQQKQISSIKSRDNITNPIICKADSSPPPAVHLGVYRAERMLLRLLLEDISYLTKIKAALGNSFWKVPVHQQIFNYFDQEGALPANCDEAVQSRLAGLIMEELDISYAERLLDDCIKEISSSQAEERVEELQARMATLEKSGDMAGAMALLNEIGERLKRGE